MQIGIADFLLAVVRQYGGGAVRFVRKGFGAICSLLGSASSLIRPVLKKAVRYAKDKIGFVAEKAGGCVRSALASLQRRVEAVLQGKAGPLEEEPEEAETPEPATATTTAKTAEAPPETILVVEPAPPAVEPAASKSDGPEGLAQPANTSLAVLVPAVGRALVRALDRSAKTRSAGRLDTGVSLGLGCRAGAIGPVGGRSELAAA